MTITEIISQIERDWPDISDKNNCARWIVLGREKKRFPEDLSVDHLCSFWSRHEHA